MSDPGVIGMTLSPKPVGKLPLRNDDSVRELYADVIVSITFTNGNFHLTFAAIRSDPSVEPSSNYRHVVARLVLPTNCMMEMQETTARAIAQLRQKQVLPQPPSPEAMRH